MKYHKIQSIFKRNPETNYTTFLEKYSCEEFDYLKNNLWLFEEKLDGTNVRYIYTKDSLDVRGRTDNAQFNPQVLKTLETRVEKAQLDTIFGGDKAVLYGEGIGEKINNGGKYCKGHDFVLFDVNINGWWLKREDVREIAHKLGIDAAEEIGRGSLEDAVAIVSEGFNSVYGDFIAEGIVARPSVELKSRAGSRIITKVKHKDFLT